MSSYLGSGAPQVSRCQTHTAWIHETEMTDALSVADSENAHMLVAVTYIRPVLISWALAHVCLMNSLASCRQSDGSFSRTGTSNIHEREKLRKRTEYGGNISGQSRFCTMQKGWGSCHWPEAFRINTFFITALPCNITFVKLDI